MVEAAVSNAAVSNASKADEPTELGRAWRLATTLIIISGHKKMRLLFLTGNTLIVDGVSNFNEKFAIFLLCLY